MTNRLRLLFPGFNVEQPDPTEVLMYPDEEIPEQAGESVQVDGLSFSTPESEEIVACSWR